MLDLAAGAEVVERPAVAEADELRARGRSRTNDSSGYRATATHSPFSRRPYSASGLTAAATFAGSVQGVVVQIDERLARLVEQREADVERRVAAILVDAALRQLVL